jgi:hypothetical protein
MNLYPGRTFRFCFSNRQMADAVTDFIWKSEHRRELRPDTEPVYSVFWDDDAYSKDLTATFESAMRGPLVRYGAVAIARDVAWGYGGAATGSLPLNLYSLRSSQFRLGLLVAPQVIDSSVGGFERPNRWEWRAAEWLFGNLGEHQTQRRPLLVLAAQSKPARRFLRALVDTDNAKARQFVVATGDALAFNTIYRDRNVAWPIQDLPLNLVFFCHRNPIDAGAGFRPDSSPATDPDNAGPSGTEDLLLFQDIITALNEAAYREGTLLADTKQLGDRLRAVRLADSSDSSAAPEQALFDEEGNRRTGTGEHVVWLEPRTQGERVFPEARIHVWFRRADSSWQSQGEPLEVYYDGSTH